jgi:signal transduction histidine kinase
MAIGASYTRNVVLAFATVALCFLSTSLFLAVRNVDIDAKTAGLLTNSLPSVEHIDFACDDLRDLEIASEALSELPPAERAAAVASIDEKWRDAERQIASYRETPDYPGEWEAYSTTVPPAMEGLRRAMDKLRAHVQSRDEAGARHVVDAELRPAARTAIGSLRRLMELNARHAFDDTRSISRLRKSSDRFSIALNAAALLIGIVATVWVLRVFRSYGRLLLAHNALTEQRATDLEQFGRRVAHDLLSPLSALSFCLGAFKKPSEGDPKLQDALARAKACIVRAQGLVDGVFEFSRAGGKPDLGDDADVDVVVHDVVDEAGLSKDVDGPELTVEAFEPVRVACTPGVLSAILSNLLRNAAKYMSDSAVKKVTVRVVSEEESVRIEVEDTGPGVPAGLESVIFEPYVRAQGVTQPGLGLGLATVKRFCVAHGGDVGVRSSPGLGAVFWFTLPRARARAS